MKIEIDLEGRDEKAAFYALYAGLRMIKTRLEEDTPDGLVSIAAAEAYCILEDFKTDFPTEFEQAKVEYEKANYDQD